MIRLGIIGCGNMAHQHLDAFERLKDVLHVSVVCDALEGRAERTMEISGADRFVTDYTKIVDDVDAVLIALPHKLHFPVGKFFIEHGKHVLMEKPLCIKEQECLDLTALAERHGVVLMTAYPVRFWEEVVKMKSYMQAGVIGEVFQMTIYTDHYNPPRDTRATWMSCADIGGGQTFSHGCHYIDILLWFLGNPVSGTLMGTSRGTPWLDREGTAHVVIKFENGALGYHTGTWGAKGTTNHTKFEVYGTEGTLSYSNIGQYKGKLMLMRNIGLPDAEKSETVLWDKAYDTAEKTSGEIEHFVQCVLYGTKPLTDGYIGTTDLRVVWKLYEAEMAGTVADLRGLGFEQPFISHAVCTFDCDSDRATANYADQPRL